MSIVLCGTDLDKRKRIVTNVKLNGESFAIRAKQVRNLKRNKNSEKIHRNLLGSLWIEFVYKSKSDVALLGYEFVGLSYYRILKHKRTLHWLSSMILSHSTFPSFQCFFIFLFKIHWREYTDLCFSLVSTLCTWMSKITNSSQVVHLVGGSKPTSCRFPNSILNSSHFALWHALRYILILKM